MKYGLALTASLHLTSSFLALAGDPPQAASDLTVAYTLPRVKVTHYSATPRGGRPCKFECTKKGCVGGKDESSSGIRPLSATLEQPGLIKGRRAVLTAVPQKGGSGGTFGCFFALPDAYPGVTFFAGDVYGSSSNGLYKADISSQCTPLVNSSKYSRMEVFNCKGLKGIPVGQQVQRDPPKPPKREALQSKTGKRRQPAASSEYDWARRLWQDNNGG